MKPVAPTWSIPENLAELVAADPEEMWEDNRWSPFLLTVMGGTSYAGRDIPLAWEVEFEPGDEAFEVANERLERLGIEPDGYGWSQVVRDAIQRHHPEIVDELHFDEELATRVVWVESESACRRLMNVLWSLLHEDSEGADG
jgi:hypothetical protein